MEDSRLTAASKATDWFYQVCGAANVNIELMLLHWND